MSSTTTASLTGPNIQDQIDKLASYVHSEISDMNNSMSRMEKLLVEMRNNQLQTPSLDITHLPPSTSDNL
jgi:uncharacterized membrane protein